MNDLEAMLDMINGKDIVPAFMAQDAQMHKAERKS